MNTYTFVVESHSTCLFALVTTHFRINGYPAGCPRGIRIRPPEATLRLRDSCDIGNELAARFGEIIAGSEDVLERLRSYNSLNLKDNFND